MMKWIIKGMLIIVLMSINGYSDQSNREKSSFTEDQNIVSEALDVSLNIEKIGKYLLYEMYDIDTIESRIYLSESIVTLGTSIKKLKLKLINENLYSTIVWVEESYHDLLALLDAVDTRDRMILIQEYVSMISRNMRDIAMAYSKTPESRSSQQIQDHMRINLEASVRYYIMYESKVLSYDDTGEVLTQTVDEINVALENLEEKGDPSVEKLHGDWKSMEEIYSDRDEGNLLPEVIDISDAIARIL